MGLETSGLKYRETWSVSLENSVGFVLEGEATGNLTPCMSYFVGKTHVGEDELLHITHMLSCWMCVYIYIYMATSQSPLKLVLKWVVNSPAPKWDPIGFDNHSHTYIYIYMHKSPPFCGTPKEYKSTGHPRNTRHGSASFPPPAERLALRPGVQAAAGRTAGLGRGRQRHVHVEASDGCGPGEGARRGLGIGEGEGRGRGQGEGAGGGGRGWGQGEGAGGGGRGRRRGGGENKQSINQADSSSQAMNPSNKQPINQPTTYSNHLNLSAVYGNHFLGPPDLRG